MPVVLNPRSNQRMIEYTMHLSLEGCRAIQATLRVHLDAQNPEQLLNITPRNREYAFVDCF